MEKKKRKDCGNCVGMTISGCPIYDKCYKKVNDVNIYSLWHGIAKDVVWYEPTAMRWKVCNHE